MGAVLIQTMATTAGIHRWPIPTTTVCIFPLSSGRRVGEVIASPTLTRRRWTTSGNSSSALRTTEHVRLEAIVEGFNLFNHVNGVSLNGTFGTGVYPTTPLPNFKQTTAVADPRSFQLALRVSF